jgi:hypothetical protein
MNRNLFLILVCVLLVNTAFCGRAAEPQTEQEKAVAEITKPGGKVAVDGNIPKQPAVSVDFSGTNVIFLVLPVLFVFLSFIFFFVVILAWTFRPWIQAQKSGTPITPSEILGMRFRRIDVKAVLKSLIMARQAGVAISCRQMESAYLQGVDLEKLTLAMIRAKKEGMELTFEELVQADLEDRLAEKLGRQVGSISGMGTARGDASAAEATEGHSVRICTKCSKQVTDDSKICRNCGAIL